MIEQLRPTKGKILVKRIQKENITESGIFLPESEETEIYFLKGIILRLPLDYAGELKTKDIVYFNLGAGLHIDDDIFMLKEDRIIGYESI